MRWLRELASILTSRQEQEVSPIVTNDRQNQLPKYTDPVEQSIKEGITVALPSLDFAFREVERLLDIQSKAIDSLDTKAQVSLGLVGVVAAALYSNLYYLLQLHYHPWTPYIITVGSILLGSAGVLALRAYRVRDWSTTPDIGRMQDYLTWDEAIAKYILINTMKDVFEENAKHAAEKANLINWVQRFFLATVIIFLVAYLLNVFYAPVAGESR